MPKYDVIVEIKIPNLEVVNSREISFVYSKLALTNIINLS